jgi:hypothetical protein
LQDKFNWKGVAAAAVGAGAGYAVGDALSGALPEGVHGPVRPEFSSSLGVVGGNLARATLSGFVAGMATAAMRGGRISAARVATDAFGNALGYSLAEGFGQTSGSIAASQQSQTLSEIGQETSRASLPSNYWSMTADAGGATGTRSDGIPVLPEVTVEGRRMTPEEEAAYDAEEARRNAGGRSTADRPFLDYSAIVGSGRRAGQSAPAPAATGTIPYINPQLFAQRFAMAERGVFQPGNTLGQRAVNLGLAAGTFVPMLLEEGGRALANAPGQLASAFRNGADVFRAPTVEQRVVAGLSALTNLGNVAGAGLVLTPMGRMAPMTAQEMAISKFNGTAATAEARATYAIGEQPSKYGYAFFGKDNLTLYYSSSNQTLGASGNAFFFTDNMGASKVVDAASAARYSGMAPSAQGAYLAGESIYGIAFPTAGLKVRLPTAADAKGFEHFLEGGYTAVKTTGRNPGYLVNTEAREFVTPGGKAVPSGSVLFKVGPTGESIPIFHY